jgi:hypothetical protein
MSKDSDGYESLVFCWQEKGTEVYLYPCGVGCLPSRSQNRIIHSDK